ncbi:hypothetical protein AVEN_123052-1 [Araneus ventricosus]|uniref:Integrase zinc-binding domain-containing protein n=1 Tax=Araneus ventricosus TaxID=182803 RepID=A0A4Y2ME56_ARAVE|nr:hypothetical protein AVEN_123052-1 [Araneus ventricosus]
MRSCRISKQVLAPLVDTVMVMWLLGPISDDGSYPGKMGDRPMSRSSKDENFANWTNRGYLMNQGILYRYSPEVETEAQLVVTVQERERVLQQHHDVPTAGHYGAEGTYKKVASRYYFPGMRKYIAEYVKNCPDCKRCKPSNQKPTGLLRTPVYVQRFETLAFDFFGPLPETSSDKKKIFLVDDTNTKWVEFFALKEATSVNCAKTLD